MAREPSSKPKPISSIWKLNLIPKVKLLAWKLVRNILLTIDKVRHFGIDIEGVFSIIRKKKLLHIFINCDLAYTIWLITNYY